MILSPENDSPQLRQLYKQLAEAGKKEGSLLIPQIGHAGRQTPYNIEPRPWSASTVRLVKSSYSSRPHGQPRELTTEEVKTEVVDRFVFTAKRLFEAGFDGVELHGAHGYLLAQFLSPTTNHRTDKYGGPVENRARVVLESYDAIRAKIPASTGFVTGIKLNSVEFQEGGLQTNDIKKFVQLLEAKGFDFIEVSGGNYEAFAFHHTKESTKKREAYFLEFAEDIKRSLTKLRVYVTGGFRTAERMAKAIQEGATDGIGLGRPITAELDLPKTLVEDRASSAPYSQIPESELGLAILACDTQMWQAGQSTIAQTKGAVNYGVSDFSTKEKKEKYYKVLIPFTKKIEEVEDAGEAFYGILQYSDEPKNENKL